MNHDLIIHVDEIRGQCPVYRVGDRMTFLEGYRLDLTRTDALCSHAMASLAPWLAALSKGVRPSQLGLALTDRGDAFVQCPDPGQERTGGGTVVFRIHVAGLQRSPGDQSNGGS